MLLINIRGLNHFRTDNNVNKYSELKQYKGRYDCCGMRLHWESCKRRKF